MRARKGVLRGIDKRAIHDRRSFAPGILKEWQLDVSFSRDNEYWNILRPPFRTRFFCQTFLTSNQLLLRSGDELRHSNNLTVIFRDKYFDCIFLIRIIFILCTWSTLKDVVSCSGFKKSIFFTYFESII